MTQWSVARNRNPPQPVLLDACLHWLKLESEGEKLTASDFSGFADSMDGRALTIDFDQRTLRSLGVDRVADEGADPPAAF